MKAVLLHHAGGDKYAFKNVQQWLLPEVESIALELPGRGDRFSDPFIQTVEAAVDDIYEQLLRQLPESYCIVGNSMGSILAFLLTHKLIRNQKTKPQHIFLVARLSPDAYKNEPNIKGIPSDDFWKVVQQYDGVPQQLLAHKELKELYEPVLRSDFELLQQYNETFQSIEPIDIAVSILLGEQDAHNVSAEKMQGWQKFFTNEVDICTFTGGHFFLYENKNSIDFIKQQLQLA